MYISNFIYILILLWNSERKPENLTLSYRENHEYEKLSMLLL